MEDFKNLQIGQIWQHYKGNHYKILVLTKHSETAEPLVVYERQEDLKTYARPLDLFFSNVEINGETVPRFVLKKDVN
ncbi:MAG: DUF1653 domain-containing protein [Candidatus Pacebacteria bacterium]|nr:DUF1653 domain-containing protein [Candidatus Paceibacterota bacterium]